MSGVHRGPSIGWVRTDLRQKNAQTTENALNLFIELAKAQPFEDGNRRTALFVANALLTGADADTIPTIPVDEDDPAVADEFNDLLARAYVRGERDGLKDLLRDRGLTLLKNDGLGSGRAGDLVTSEEQDVRAGMS